MKVTLPSTIAIKAASERVVALQDALPSILSQSRWKHQIPIKDKIEFLREIASARISLWGICESEYPQIHGKPYEVKSWEVSYTTPTPPTEGTSDNEKV